MTGERQFQAPKPVRAPTFKPLSAMQAIVVDLLGMRMGYAEIGLLLKIQPVSVRRHARGAARKIPGDLPAQAKVMAWARGATIDVLEGHSLRYYVQSRATIQKTKKDRAKVRREHQKTDHSDRAVAAAPADTSSLPIKSPASAPASEHP